MALQTEVQVPEAEAVGTTGEKIEGEGGRK
jgi:hypothetical protein